MTEDTTNVAERADDRALHILHVRSRLLSAIGGQRHEPWAQQVLREFDERWGIDPNDPYAGPRRRVGNDQWEGTR